MSCLKASVVFFLELRNVLPDPVDQKRDIFCILQTKQKINKKAKTYSTVDDCGEVQENIISNKRFSL